MQRNNNGIDTHVESLEMFFSGLPRLISFKPFPNLLKLVIANQLIERIEGLETCVNLQELWITECKLKVCIHTYLVRSLVTSYDYYRILQVFCFSYKTRQIYIYIYIRAVCVFDLFVKERAR